MDLRERYNSLDEGLKEKLKACRTRDELILTLKDAGFELSADDLSLISGGRPEGAPRGHGRGNGSGNGRGRRPGPRRDDEAPHTADEDDDENDNPLKYWIVDGCSGVKSGGCSCD